MNAITLSALLVVCGALLLSAGRAILRLRHWKQSQERVERTAWDRVLKGLRAAEADLRLP